MVSQVDLVPIIDAVLHSQPVSPLVGEAAVTMERQASIILKAARSAKKVRKATDVAVEAAAAAIIVPQMSVIAQATGLTEISLGTLLLFAAGFTLERIDAALLRMAVNAIREWLMELAD